MEFKQLNILNKKAGTPLEIVTVTSRLGTPLMVQPSYTFDLSMMYGVFIPEVSFGSDFAWNSGILEVVGGVGGALKDLTDVSLNTPLNDQLLAYDTSVSLWINKTAIDVSFYAVEDISVFSWDSRLFFYTKNEIDSLLDAVVGGTY
jgi:hypothetical protein